jgi:hypothetical protein
MGYPQRNRRREIERSGPCEPGVPVTRACRRVREQITSHGFDDFRQLVPDGLGAPARTGIRIPPAPYTTIGSAYMVLLCSAVLGPGDCLVGIRQGIEIGQGIPGGDEFVTFVYPEIRPVVTYNWRFSDGSTNFILTREPLKPRNSPAGPLDMDSFRFRDAQSALVYAAATIPAGPPLPGYLGLSAYTPPALRGQVVLNVRDLRWPWDRDECNDDLWLEVDKPTRFRLYCLVAQTDPTTRPVVTFSPSADFPLFAAGAVPEETFLQVFTHAIYWAALGRMIVERSSTPL